MRVLKQIQPAGQSPDELLQVLDLELILARSRRGGERRNRVLFLTAGLLFVLGGAFAALMVLSQMLADLPRPAAQNVAATEVAP